MEESEEWSSPRKCAITSALQHLHKWPTNTQGHSEFHLCRRFVYCDTGCIIWEDRINPQRSIRQYGRLLREEPFACQPRHAYSTSGKANRQLNISWCGKKLEHTPSPIYLGVTLDRTLSYSTHITKVKAKTAARNNVVRKLANSKWGTHPSTIKTTALALCYSTAEYACPVWETSAHAHKVDPVLNDACRAITGCLQPTNVDNLYLLAGIAPPAVRRSVTAQQERENKWTTTNIHYTSPTYQGNALNPETASYMPQTN